MDVLSKLSVLMMDEDFSESLRNAKTVDEFLNIIDKADDEKPDIDERLETAQAAKVLAVTSCPTGIAHTYMAAEGIEKAAKAKLAKAEAAKKAAKDARVAAQQKRHAEMLAARTGKKLIIKN